MSSWSFLDLIRQKSFYESGVGGGEGVGGGAWRLDSGLEFFFTLNFMGSPKAYGRSWARD